MCIFTEIWREVLHKLYYYYLLHFMVIFLLILYLFLQKEY